MTYLLATFIIAWAWQTYRKRVWKRRFNLLMSEQGKEIVKAFSDMWAKDHREKARSEWPEELEG